LELITSFYRDVNIFVVKLYLHGFYWNNNDIKNVLFLLDMYVSIIVFFRRGLFVGIYVAEFVTLNIFILFMDIIDSRRKLKIMGLGTLLCRVFVKVNPWMTCDPVGFPAC
jgi:hypothetical protein